ncbi:MAG TPA: MFS transporter [Anaerolineales bacterium]|nr:MFS transporter [Anaerolineales bacterium]
MSSKWRTITLLSIAELLGMAVWFSASAVVASLADAWSLNDSGRAWLTMSVQAGFVIGAFGSALLNLSDIIPAPRLIAVSSFLAALSTLLIPLFVESLPQALALRVLTGIFLAGVYPVGMKVITTWTQQDRGLAIGLMVGALAIGSASPHLLNAFGGSQDWRLVMFWAAGLAALGGLLALFFVREGPLKKPTPKFNWKYVGEILRERDLVLANAGYLGHMWELYAMWAWIAVFLTASFEVTGLSGAWASLAAFAVIGMGGLGSLLAGRLADRYGRTTVTIVSLAVSGVCCLVAGLLFGGNPFVLTILCLVWGFAIVADSAQFSAAISELCHTEYTGTALTLQTSLGFLLTLLTIRLTATLEGFLGWNWAFAFLAIGPALGIWAMYTLRQSPRARQLAGGRC